MHRDQALAILRRALPAVERDFRVQSVGVFGSVARDESQDASDVDVLVTFHPAASVTLNTLAALHERLESLLGCPVDLVEDHPRLRPSFRTAIEKDLLRVA